jgi:serine O-acetyltransferase
MKDTETRFSSVIERLTNCALNDQCADYPLPSAQVLSEVVTVVRSLLFPGYFGDVTLFGKDTKTFVQENLNRLQRMLSEQILAGLCFSEHCIQADKHIALAEEKTLLFIEHLPVLRELLSTDVQATYDGDPAANSYSEVIFCYPGIRAISSYRIAHALNKLGIPIIPRIISELAHSDTGIDIHPEAQIGSYFTIDHGTGIVIGATSIIGSNVQIYQGVTLGAKSFPLDENGNPIKGIPRHPIIEDDVVIYANATVLGRITVGKGAMIGGNVWVTEDVQPGAKVLQSAKRF